MYIWIVNSSEKGSFGSWYNDVSIEEIFREEIKRSKFGDGEEFCFY